MIKLDDFQEAAWEKSGPTGDAYANFILHKAGVNEWEVWKHADEAAVKNLSQCKFLFDCIGTIENNGLRAFVLFVLAKANQNFWLINASSTGKYHPRYDNEEDEDGRSGLIRHVRMCVAIAGEGLRRYGYGPEIAGSNPDECAKLRDMVVAAALLHDWAKNGSPQDQSNTRYAAWVGPKWGKHTEREHGENAAVNIEQNLFPLFLKVCKKEISSADLKELEQELLPGVVLAIKEHYGVWAKNHFRPYGPELSVLDPDGTKHFDRLAALIIQEADYYSSRSLFEAYNEEGVAKAIGNIGTNKIARLIKR